MKTIEELEYTIAILMKDYEYLHSIIAIKKEELDKANKNKLPLWYTQSIESDIYNLHSITKNTESRVSFLLSEKENGIKND